MAEKRGTTMIEMSFKVGDDNTEPLETAVLVNSMAGLVRWIFFIILAILVAKYIKKKNADSWTNKHS